MLFYMRLCLCIVVCVYPYEFCLISLYMLIYLFHQSIYPYVHVIPIRITDLIFSVSFFKCADPPLNGFMNLCADVLAIFDPTNPYTCQYIHVYVDFSNDHWLLLK